MVEITPQPHAALELPASTHTVTVRPIDTTTRLVCASSAFVKPVIPGHESLNFPTLCFLVEHETPAGTDYVLFDAGSRKDFWNTTPMTQKMIGAFTPGMEVDYNVDELLTKSGFDLKKLKAVIWSHWHWDHIGDGSKFPASADIVVGPGFTENFVPGYPVNPNSYVLQSDLEGHRVHEPEFNLDVGGFPAYDYFGDGSFYLMDVPGHAQGHICGFARTTPDSFVFMGADCCHYAGALRPNPYVPLPAEIPAEQLDDFYPSPCPCSHFTKYHPQRDDERRARTEPFYGVSTEPDSAYSFAALAQATLKRLLLFDGHPDIFVCLAHDGSLFKMLPLFNQDPTNHMNDWKAKKYNNRTHWGFLNELPKDGKPGRPLLVDGLYKDGKQIKYEDGKWFL